MQDQKYQKTQFCIQLYIDIWEIILYLQANPYLLKTKNINCLICITTITNVNVLPDILKIFLRKYNQMILILAPGREFSCTKCVQFLLTITE